jgi:hypothetical protein
MPQQKKQESEAAKLTASRVAIQKQLPQKSK